MTHFSGCWTVPEAPATVGKQILFLHLGVEGLSASKTVFLPCVLQWGETPFGGGRCWSVACWSQSGRELEVSEFVRVQPGDTVEARIVRSVSAGRELWRVSASVGDELTELSIALADPLSGLKFFGGALEAYGPGMEITYPACASVSFRELKIETESGQLTPRWQAVDEVQDGGQQTQVVSPSRVDIFFRPPPAATAL